MKASSTSSRQVEPSQLQPHTSGLHVVKVMAFWGAFKGGNSIPKNTKSGSSWLSGRGRGIGVAGLICKRSAYLEPMRESCADRSEAAFSSRNELRTSLLVLLNHGEQLENSLGSIFQHRSLMLMHGHSNMGGKDGIETREPWNSHPGRYSSRAERVSEKCEEIVILDYSFPM